MKDFLSTLGIEHENSGTILNTNGNILSECQQIRIEKFISAGNGFVGIHSATATEYDWEWYGELLGTYFDNHPKIQEATLTITDSSHPSTRNLPATWAHTDEWYNFRNDLSEEFKVLISLDEQTYSGGTMGKNHPVSWCRDIGESRIFYTALGHSSESYSDPIFLKHLIGGIGWVTGKDL